MNPHRTLFMNFDTVNTITIYHDSKAPLEEAVRLCGRCERLFSRFRPGSDLWRINHAGGAPVEVDGMTAELIDRGISYVAATEGAFNIAVGALTALWDFSGQAPPPREEPLRQRLAWTDCAQIQRDGRTVRVPAGMELDLGGIAKGYIADKLVELLRAEGVRSGVVNLGGNVCLLGRKPDGALWKVGLQSPVEDSSQWSAALEAEDVSVVTSGSYERGFDWEGTWMHHVLDPKTGRPAKSDLAAVSVVCGSSTDADVYSTAFLCLGSARTKQRLKDLPDLKVFLHWRDGSTQWCGARNVTILPGRTEA